jgi:phosphate acetyltransferase
MNLREAVRHRAAGLEARLVFPEGGNPRVQEAARELERLGIAEPVLLDGAVPLSADDELLAAIGARLRSARPDAVRDGVHALELAADPMRHAAGLLALGRVDGCVAGAVMPTAEVLRAALWLVGTNAEIPAVTAAMYHGLADGRVLTYTDVAVIPTPTPEQLAGAAIAAADDRPVLVGDQPVVAFLSFSTKGSASGAEVERVREAWQRFREARPEVASDGELQLDAALVPEVAARKCPGSPVAGRANVLVFPSLDAANIGYKLTERLAGATAAGPLLQGLAKPITDLSRGASPDDIVDVAAMVALQAHAANSRPREER